MNTDPIPDILWDGCLDPMGDPTDPAQRNCLSNNGDATFVNGDLCGMPSTLDFDITKVTCEP